MLPARNSNPRNSLGGIHSFGECSTSGDGCFKYCVGV